MLIANVNNTRSLSTMEVIELTADNSMSNDINDLRNAHNQTFRFNPVNLKDFSTTFTQLRFYCHKPGHTTIHLHTLDTALGKSVLDYFMLKTNTRPKACGSFETYADDNSVLAGQCLNWVGGRWAGLSITANRIYNFPFYISGQRHYGVIGTRLECDDQGQGNSGVWEIFVR